MLRRLSYDELLVLRLVQTTCGAHHSLAEVAVTGAADACLTLRDSAGAARGLVNLTLLGGWYRSGAMTLPELRAWIARACADPGP